MEPFAFAVIIAVTLILSEAFGQGLLIEPLVRWWVRRRARQSRAAPAPGRSPRR